MQKPTEKGSYSELFWSVFSRIWTEYRALYSVRMRENTDQNNSEYGHFLRSDKLMTAITFYLKYCLQWKFLDGKSPLWKLALT